jgi:TrpR-related protein YerC/YecD
MQISKLKLNKEIEKKTFEIFYQTLSDLKTPEEVRVFLRDFMTITERMTLAKRLMTALFLEQGKSYDYIKQNLKVSSATIAHVDSMMKKGNEGFIIAFKKIDADEWAEKLTQKISSFFSKISGK